MGLGSFDFSFKHDADVVRLPAAYDHVIAYQGEERIYTGVILRTRPGPVAAIGGAGVDWWLGKDSDGPTIVDHEYISAQQKLSNGDFEDGVLLWRLEEGTLWEIRSVPGEPYAGDWCATLGGPAERDEVLQSDESFECAPNDFFYVQCRHKRAAPTVGRLRLRIVYQGRFRHPNIVDNVSTWADVSETAGDASDDGTSLILGPTTEQQSIKNASFEAVPGLEHWYDQDARGWVTTGPPDIGQFEGFACVTLPAYGAGGGVLMYDDDETTAPPAIEPIIVTPGEEIFLQIAVTPYAEAGGTTAADGRVYAGVLLLDAADANPVFFRTDIVTSADVPVGVWVPVSVQFTVPENRVHAHPFIQAYDVTVGTWAFDAFTLTHQRSNEAALESPGIATQTPGRRYRLLAPVTSDPGVEGSLKARVRFSATGRPDVIVESSGMDPTGGEEKLLTFDYEPPSGYTTATVTFVAVDVKGGSFSVRKSGVALVDDDASTKILAEAISATSTSGWDLLYIAAPVAPVGSERCHVEVVAEADDPSVTDSWLVDDILFIKIAPLGVAHGEDIVDDLLHDPDTGDYILLPGTIHPAGLILHDWRIRNLTNRDALAQLSTSALLDDKREWRVKPDATVDWGLPDEIFEDRADLVLVEGDLILKRPPDAASDVTNRPSKVKLIGADRTPVGGQKQIITGEATEALDGVDLQGNPINRTRIVEDSTVDTKAYADGRADIELANTAGGVDQTQFDLADWKTAGGFDVGDTIYAYVPAAGLVDEANPVDRDGVTVWPVGRRVVARTRKLGSDGFRLEVRRGDGTVDDVTDLVDWETETSAQVTFGAPRPDFVLDPQGGAAGRQFRRYRASTPR